MRGIYAQRLDTLAGLVRKHLSDFVEPHVPIGGLQMPCVLTGEISERAAIDAARRVGVDLLGLSGLYAAGDGEPGFLMGFAAYTPMELEGAVRKLVSAFQALRTPV